MNVTSLAIYTSLRIDRLGGDHANGKHVIYPGQLVRSVVYRNLNMSACTSFLHFNISNVRFYAHIFTVPMWGCEVANLRTEIHL